MDWGTLGASPGIEALENALLAEHEVVCDVTHKTSPIGGHVLLIIDSGWYLKDVVDPTFVQNQACWLGSWWLTLGGSTHRLLLRRCEDMAAPGTPRARQRVPR